jgi:hypothetical protein
VRALDGDAGALLGGGLDQLLERVRTAGSDRFADDVALVLVAYASD